MASSQLFITLVIVVVFAPSSLAKDYVVGDEKGWTVGFDYDAWAKKQQFAVGDTITFKYPPGAHNLVEVSGPEYEKCEAPPSAKPMTSGEDKIKLDAPGKKYFLCSIGKHCEMGKQRVAITVESTAASGSSPSSSPTATPSSDPKTPSEPKESAPTASTPPSPSPSAATRSIIGTYGFMVIVISGILGLLFV